MSIQIVKCIAIFFNDLFKYRFMVWILEYDCMIHYIFQYENYLSNAKIRNNTRSSLVHQAKKNRPKLAARKRKQNQLQELTT
jgi:uncharacterized ion transporter superfamily protein YfcC